MKTLRRSWALVQFSLAVVLRLRVGWSIGLGAIMLVAGGALLREMHFGSAEAGFLVDYVGAILALGGALLAALAGPAVFFEGLRARTTVVLLLHGAPRGAVVAAHVAAVLVVLGWLAVLCALAAVALLHGLGHGAFAGAALVVLARGAGPLVVLAAAGVFFATLTRGALLATVLTLALALAGHLAPAIAHAAAHVTGAARAGWTLLGWLVPNFSAAEGASGLIVAVYFVAYAIVYTALAAWVFSRREL
ncbi:MAG: hypothetical protein HYV96_21345 [Opitutae bacterium]|nr:hypothetical protein [Opitutae bacterium]